MLWLWWALASGACDERSDAAKEATSKALAGLAIQSQQIEDASGMVERVVKLHADGHLCSSTDKQQAAVVLLRGDSDALALAHQLASESYAENPLASAGRTAAMAFDRRRVDLGEPQSYGVVRARVDGRPCLYPIDPEVPDADRVALGLPPLEGLLQEFLDKYALTTEASVAALQAEGFFCPLAKQEPTEEQEFAGLDPTATDDPYEGAVTSTDLADGGQATRGRSGATLTHGELYGQYGYWSGNAYTVEKGQLILHPFMRSFYGVADGVQIGTNLLSNFAVPGILTDSGPVGANLHVEVAPVQSQHGAFSVEGGFATAVITNDLLDSYHVYGEFKGTGYVSQTVSITGALMGARHVYSDGRLVDRLRPKVAMEISISQSAMAILSARTDVLGFRTGGAPNAGGGAYVAFASGPVGFSFGANVDVQEVQVYDADGDVVDVALPILLSPHLQLWFRAGR
jgi:hypothetical protein